MKSVDRIDINKKRAIPPATKLILMIAVIIGLLLHTCWKKTQGDNLQISDIQLSNITHVSLDISFTIASRASVELEKSFMIEIYTTSGELLANKLTRLTIPPKTRKRYIKVLQKFNMPLNNPDDIGDFKVYIYK
ncbi:MAG: hypothetical protein P9M11_01375 [Candidatus Tenebribacter burtonii]|jgi:hypothetical protein|nr:hypothetical protein [Candidatus Tenebribacter burtonii]